MQEVTHALSDVKDLFPKVAGQPAPEVGPHQYTPFPPGVDPMVHAVQEVEHLKQLSQTITHTPTTPTWIPRADSFVADDAFVVRVEVPGVARDDLKVLVAGAECVVRGTRKPTESTEKLRPMTLERTWGPFERRFLLPAGSHPEQLSARYQDGVLELRMKVDPKRAPKEMKIELE